MVAGRTGTSSLLQPASQVMRQIARWYDVDINYEGKVPERDLEVKFQGTIMLLKY
jgi:hypothetical protein